MKKQKGYTLIEMVVVVGILVIISMLVTGILYSTIRGGSKSSITNLVSQNGTFALSQISSIINSSTDVLGVGDITPFTSCSGSISGNKITVKRTDGGATTLSCSKDSIASQSASGTVNFINRGYVQVVGGVCSFKCSQNSVYSAPVIEIQFSLSDASTSVFSENKAAIPFGTKVLMKNYQSQ